MILQSATCWQPLIWLTLNVFTQLSFKKEPITQTLAYLNILNTQAISYLKFGNTILHTIQWKSDTMDKLGKFLSATGKLNVLLKLSMLGINNLKIKIIFKLVVSIWLMSRHTFQLQLLNSWLFLSSHCTVLFVALKTRKDQKVPSQAS